MMPAEPALSVKKPLPLLVLLLLAQLYIELAVIGPAALYKLGSWAPHVNEPQLSPFIFSCLAFIGFLFVGVRTVLLVHRRSPGAYAFCQLFLMLHVAAGAIGVGCGLFLYAVHGESDIAYEIMAVMAVITALYLGWNKIFKSSARVRSFFEQPEPAASVA